MSYTEDVFPVEALLIGGGRKENVLDVELRRVKESLQSEGVLFRVKMDIVTALWLGIFWLIYKFACGL